MRRGHSCTGCGRRLRTCRALCEGQSQRTTPKESRQKRQSRPGCLWACSRDGSSHGGTKLWLPYHQHETETSAAQSLTRALHQEGRQSLSRLRAQWECGRTAPSPPRAGTFRQCAVQARPRACRPTRSPLQDRPCRVRPKVVAASWRDGQTCVQHASECQRCGRDPKGCKRR